MKDFTSCPVCHSSLRTLQNDFCQIRSQLLFADLEFKQYLCPRCQHSTTWHNIPLELIYKAENALATDRESGDLRLEFIRRHLDLSTVEGLAVEVGGGPGELAEQVRIACGHERGMVVDFVDRVAFESLSYVHADLNDCETSLPVEIKKSGHREKKNIFLLSHLLEHIFEPANLLKTLGNFENSYFFIEVPDFGVTHDKSALKYSINCPDHIHYFNATSLITLIQNCGFTILAFEQQSLPLVPALRVLCKKAAPHCAVYEYDDHLQYVSNKIINAIEEAETGSGIYLWGLSPFAAHAIQQMQDTKGKITCIFDTKYHSGTFEGIPVIPDPFASAYTLDEASVVICGSTFSVVQNAMKKKLDAALSPARFITITWE